MGSALFISSLLPLESLANLNAAVAALVHGTLIKIMAPWRTAYHNKLHPFSAVWYCSISSVNPGDHGGVTWWGDIQASYSGHVFGVSG